MKLRSNVSKVALGGILAIALASACERIAYYSISGATAAGDGGPGDDDDDGPNPMGTTVTVGTGIIPVSRADVLAGVATCATQLYGEVAVATQELSTAVSALEAAPSAETEATAREAWSKTMGLWQRAEVLRVGPAGPLTLPEGKALRDYVYSWPLVSRCLVDQNIVSQKFADPAFPTIGLVNVRGLYAAEYLLFYAGTDNACSAQATINASGSWNALGADGLAARKRAYAAVLASDLASQTTAIHGGWTDGGFAALLGNAGGSGSPFASDQAALNAVSDGMFYVEREVKDMKLAKPLGKTVDCPEATCPGDVESLYAKVARDHIRNNLLGFQRIFDGCEAAPDTGFDDLLRTVGAGDLATRMSGDVAAAILATDALPSSDLGAVIETDLASAEALYTAVKRVTDMLKTDFVTVLDLELPKNLEGDND